MKKQTWMGCGATCIGPAHVANGLPNQDSWQRFAGKHGPGIVVCDGIGSLPHADIGSQAACIAVAQAFGAWHAHPDATTDHLIRLIHLFWAMKVEAVGQSTTGTTCLFAVVQPNRAVLVGQLGDGGVLIEDNQGRVTTLTPPADKLGGTTGLGVARNVNEWTIRRLEPDDCVLVMLATDGAYDDLDPAHLDRFVGFLRRSVLARRPSERWRPLYAKLKNWPAVSHSDDKTVAVLWRGSAAKPNAGRTRWKRR